MKRNIKDSVVVITGASSGIGKATALAFAERGAHVVGVSRNIRLLQEVADECSRLGGNPVAYSADVTKEEQVEHVVEDVILEYGRIDTWINNAGVHAFGRVEDIPVEVHRKIIETNVIGYIIAARAVIPRFREQGSGCLIMVSSLLGKIGAPYWSTYAASKFAIAGFAESLRMELAGMPGIRVSTVFPAAINTAFYEHSGNFVGREVKPLYPTYSAEMVAEELVNVARRPKRERVAGKLAGSARLLKAVAPCLTERLFAWYVEQLQFTKQPVRITTGNIFETSAEHKEEPTKRRANKKSPVKNGRRRNLEGEWAYAAKVLMES